MTNSEYNRPVIFRKLENGTDFMLALHDTLYIKVPPHEFVQPGGNHKMVNAMSASKIFSTWVMDVEMAYIKE